MSKIKFELNYMGVRNLLKSEGMKEMLSEKADEIQSRCGDGYESAVKYRSTRLVGEVYAQTPEAYQDNLENNTLLKNMR